MKAKNFCLIVFAILSMAVMFEACAGAAGPSEVTPKSISVQVRYERVLPVSNPQASDIVTLDWVFGSFEGGNADMPKVAEDNYTTSASIKTETVITMQISDFKKAGFVRKRIFINNIELIFNSSEYGQVKFKVHNDGSIEVISPT
ncbi:MAG: hypothetical protein E4H01_02265 [Lysobacterales bacterium]|nr:MAG: hypothetical protein E4H01_02265 [Xanthomonadales bacterium]